MTERRGMAIPLVICVITVMCLTFFGLWKMMRGVGSQLEYSDSHLRALTIAESGYNLLVSRLMSKPWELRWFAAAPDTGAALEMDRGTWDYFIQSTPGQDKMADLWVRAEYRNTRRLHFYRIRYEDLLFKNLTNPAPNYAASLEEEQNPGLSAGTVNPLTQQMNDLITQRDKNRLNMTRKWQDLAGKVNPLDILKGLGAYTGEDILDKSVPPKPGVPTDAPPVDPKPIPSKAKAFLEKIEKTESLVAWFTESLLLPPAFIDQEIRPVIIDVNQAIEALYKAERYKDAEKIYKEFLDFVFSVKVGVNQATLALHMEYYQKVALLAKSTQGKEFARRLKELDAYYKPLFKAAK